MFGLWIRLVVNWRLKINVLQNFARICCNIKYYYPQFSFCLLNYLRYCLSFFTEVMRSLWKTSKECFFYIYMSLKWHVVYDSVWDRNNSILSRALLAKGVFNGDLKHFVVVVWISKINLFAFLMSTVLILTK